MTLAEQASRLNYASGRRDLPALILMSDERRLPDPSVAARRLPPGSAVLLRHSDPDARRALVRRLAPLCRAHALVLIVSDDIDLAEACDADGLHLPERRAASFEAFAVRRRWRKLLTCAAHDSRALRRADRLGADAVLLSPVFATNSHPDQPPIGPLRFLNWIRAAGMPVYALGGVTCVNAGRLVTGHLSGRNLVGIAGIGGLA